MKKLKKRFLALLIVLSMVFTSHAFVTFAESFESATNEIELEYDGVSETLVGASSTSPEEKSDESEIEEPEDDTDESLETDYPEEPEEDETEYAEEPEEDETESIVGASSTSPEEETSNSEETAETEIEVETETEAEETIVGAKLGEPEEIEVNTEDKLFGATKYLSYITISQYTIKTYYVGDTYDPSDLKIKAYYEDADTGDEEMVEVAYIDDMSKFSFSPDCVSSPFTASTTEENPYELTITYTDDAGDDAFATTAFQVHPATTTTYTVTYNQNLPSGYAVPTSKTWYTDSTTTDLTGSPIILKGSADMTCEDTSGYVRTLQGWNTYSSGGGSSYGFGASINTDAGFIGDTLTLYAMWSDPVAPTTGFMYWKVDGDDNNKTIHYYASPGEGRAAVVIGTDGVEHTSLGSSDREKIKYAVFEDNIAATNLKCCFENFKGLESITNLRKLDTSNVTSMRQMFNFAGVKELDLTNFETSNVTDMYGMFSSCENLETIRVSDKFVVDQVPNNFGKFMFSGCENLVGEQGTKYTDTATPWGKSYAHIDEGSTNPGLFSSASTPPTPPTPPAPTPVTTDWYWYLDGTHMHYTATAGAGRTKVTFNGDIGVDYGSTDVKTVREVTIDDKISPENLHGLFRLFTSLTKINSFTNLDTSNCTDMARMFQSCSSLEGINVSHFNTSKVKDMSRVFQNCEKLKSVDVSNFDTQNAETMHQMFGTCIVITDIKFSSKFVTNKVTKMYEMFSRCEKIPSLDISSFDISSVTNANDMFASCHELVTIKTSPTLDFSSVGSGNDMFKYCFKIKGGKGTTYDENHVDKSYAHVDGGTSNPGYFTGGSSPTPLGPSPSPGGGESGGSDISDPTKGPMGDLSKNPEYANKINNGEIYTENNLPQESLKKDDNLATHLKSLPENSNSSYSNARDSYGNTGYGQWLRVPNTTTWYFFSGDLSQANGQSSGFLANGWYNLGWDGQDKWYYFDSNGVMKIGWHREGNKIYYLQADFGDNWYGKVMTGTHIIDGQVRNFDSNGVLMQ